MVLIDAAKGCVTQPPDLSKYPADFVVISFYKVDLHCPTISYTVKLLSMCILLTIFLFLLVKIFGYPTGLGALIIRNGMFSKLLS